MLPRFTIPTRPLNIAMGLTYLGKGTAHIVLADPTGMLDIALGLEYLAKARHTFPNETPGKEPKP